MEFLQVYKLQNILLYEIFIAKEQITSENIFA